MHVETIRFVCYQVANNKCIDNVVYIINFELLLIYICY